MRLAGLHLLTVAEIPTFEALHRGEVLSEKLIPGGNKKYRGSALSKAAANADITDAEMATRIGVHPSTISRLEHPQDENGRNPSLKVLKKIKREVGSPGLKQYGL